MYSKTSAAETEAGIMKNIAAAMKAAVVNRDKM
jgi:hypothetical protein